MEEPEIIKMLKYILLITCASTLVNCYPHPLVTEQPTVVPDTLVQPGAKYSEIVVVSPSAQNDKNDRKQMDSSSSPPVTSAENGRQVDMSPVTHIGDLVLETGPMSSGGQKRVREVSRDTPPSSPPGAPPPSDELGSLCSIFQFFLEPRRYSRCRVSNTATADERGEDIDQSSLRAGTESEDGFGFNPNYHRPVSNDVAPPDQRNGDSFHSESENREIETEQLPPIMDLDHNREGERQPPASKRYDHLEDLRIHGHPDDERHHLIPPPGPPPMFPKSSLDRTTIIVPERPCPRGERRDHKGYCRRIVRVRPSYQYGPPPPPYGERYQSRPYRYYYSRYVSVPTLQFFIPAVP